VVHAFGLWAREGDTVQQLSPGQWHLGTLVDEVCHILEREPRPDITIAPWPIEAMQRLDDGGLDYHGFPTVSILLPVQATDREAWISGGRHRNGQSRISLGDRFHVRNMPEKIIRWFGTHYRQNAAETRPNFEIVQKEWHVGAGGVLLICPRWSARKLWPDAFPKPIVFPKEIDEAAAKFQTSKQHSLAKSQRNHEIAIENARFSEQFQYRQIEATRKIYGDE